MNRKECKSYLMGAIQIQDADLVKLDITIEHVESSTSRMLSIPYSSLEQYKRLIREKLNNGFWTDIVGTNLIYFIFQMRDGCLIEYTYNEKNRLAIAKLCTTLNKDPLEKTTNVLAYLAENTFYTEEIAQYKKHTPGVGSSTTPGVV